MSDTGAIRPRGLHAALADIAERRRRDPNWDPRFDPTYGGPFPSILEKMTEEEYAAYEARRDEERRASLGWYGTYVYESEMALNSERMEQCGEKVLDNAGIVRDALLAHIKPAPRRSGK